MKKERSVKQYTDDQIQRRTTRRNPFVEAAIKAARRAVYTTESSGLQFNGDWVVEI